MACGNYSVVQPLLWERATDIIVLDPPRAVVMRRLVPRTVRRLVTRQALWNGNREQWSNLTSWDPERSILAWAWTQHAVYRARYREAAADPRWRHARFHFVGSGLQDPAGWLARIRSATGAGEGSPDGARGQPTRNSQ